MFLSDCCYDYLLECDPRSLGIAVALHEQNSIFRRFDRHSGCVRLDLYGRKAMKMMNTCPGLLNNGSWIESMCTDPPGKSTISSCVPVESDRVLYRNMYCAACYGLPLHQLHPVASYELLWSRDSFPKTDVHLLPLSNRIDCNYCKLTGKPTFNYIERFGDACWCHQPLPDRSCNDKLYEEDCNAYSSVVYDKFRQPYDNEACKACDSDGRAIVSRPGYCEGLCGDTSDTNEEPLVKLFDFTGISLPPVYIYARSTTTRVSLPTHAC